MHAMRLMAFLLLGSIVTPAAALGPIFGWQRPLNTDARFDYSPSRWREDWAPRVATDKHGTWLTIWEGNFAEPPPPGQDSRVAADIFVARSTNGVTWSAPVVVNTDAPGDARFDLWPTIATDGAGTWVATWNARHDFEFLPGSDLGDVYAARSIDNGATWSAPIPISAAVSVHDFFPEVVAASPGVFVVAWMSYDLAATDPDHDILFSRSTDGGVTWSAPAPLNTDASSPADFQKQDTYPTLASDGAGTVVATWNDQSFPLPWHILVARSTDGGATWSDPQSIESPEPRGNDMPFIAHDGAGTWMIAWSSFSGEYQERRLRLARSTDAGSTWSLVPASDIDGSLGPTYGFRNRIAGEPAGNWVVTWESHSILGPDVDIFMMQSFDRGLTWQSPRALNSLAALGIGQSNSSDGSDYTAQAITDGQGGWMAVWMAPGYFQTGSSYPALLETGFEGDIFFARGRFVSCDATPRAGCQVPTGSAGAKLAAKRDPFSGGGTLTWTWSGDADSSVFGDPRRDQVDILLCFYDGDTLTNEMIAPSLSLCGASSCWSSRTSSKLTYRDRDRIPTGIEKMVFKRGKFALKGSGRDLALPPMPSPLPLTVQLQGTNGGCLGATFTPDGVQRNEATRLKARRR